MQRIMIVDDEENILSALKRTLAREKEWEIEIFSDPHAALLRAQTAVFDLFISDFRMPKMNGAEFLSQVKLLHPMSQRIILSGNADIESVVNSINDAEVYRFIFKPWHDSELIENIRKAIEFRKVLSENFYLSQQVKDMEAQLVAYKNEIKTLQSSLKQNQ
jgi:two-component system, probable response regulator PhcQ